MEARHLMPWWGWIAVAVGVVLLALLVRAVTRNFINDDTSGAS